MKLLRYGPAGQEKPGLLDADGAIRDLSGEVGDIDASILSDEALAKLSALDTAALPIVEGDPRMGPCVGSIGKFICIGLNYADHAAEAGQPIPKEPIVFMKATTAVCGPDDNVEVPRTSEKLDWEVELGVIIGKRAKYISKEEALDHVAGYCTSNDVSERSFQSERSGQWTKGKSHDTFGPIGPWLVTRDEVPDPQNLNLWLDVDGERQQTGNTSTMIFDVATIVSYLSQFMTLEPGDVISTGTPPGVGMGHKPEPIFLKPGQVMTLEVEGLGRQSQTTIQA
ncbi:MAG: fumarylacetoacetate hydrolase family protein [Proteobacteria bacterium]|nr:fumarylacetoacetate hydrolase family protein [Pseudomonadota bacterium]